MNDRPERVLTGRRHCLTSPAQTLQGENEAVRNLKKRETVMVERESTLGNRMHLAAVRH